MLSPDERALVERWARQLRFSPSGELVSWDFAVPSKDIADVLALVERLDVPGGEAEHALRNLMAVIFRDGGHRADEFASLTEAGEAAEAEVVRLLTVEDRWESLKSPEMVERVAKALLAAEGRLPLQPPYLEMARAALEEITR